jgi:inner membrane protein
MLARTHDLAAITALAVVVVIHPIPELTLSTVLIALFANQIGGIAPDIDQPTAPFWRNLPIGHIFGRFAGRLLGGHRFLSHSLLGVALAGFLAKLLLEFLSPIMPKVDIDIVWSAFVIGMVSHLVMDMFTKEGVPWLLPIPVKFGIPPIRAFRITTGKKMETLVVLPVLLLTNLWIFHTNYPAILAYVHHLQR